MSMPKVLATIPVYHAVEPFPFIHFLSLSHEAGAAEAHGKYSLRWMVPGPKCKIVPARHLAASFVLKGDYSHLLLMDDDMLIPAGAIARLLSRNVDIIAPLFFCNESKPQPCAFVIDSQNQPQPYWDFPRNQLFECPGGVGTGVMLINTRVLKAMEEPYFRPSNNFRYGEDVEFCLRAIGLGFRCWCDSSITINQMGVNHPFGINQFLGVTNERKKGNIEFSRAAAAAIQPGANGSQDPGRAFAGRPEHVI